MRIKQSIAGLYNGVSQQAPSLRKETQCEAQINGYSSLERGIEKRPPTRHIAKISANTDSSLFTHRITRDKQEKYQLFVDSTGLTAYDYINSKEAPIYNHEATYSYLTNNVVDFPEDLAVITIADFSFLLNKRANVKMDPSEVMETELIDGKYRGYIYIIQPQWGIDYVLTTSAKDSSSAVAGTITRKVELQSSSAPFKTGSQHVLEKNTNGAVVCTGGFTGTTSLKASLEAGGYTVRIKGSLMEISNAENFNLEVSDTFGNNSWISYKTNIQEGGKLPEKAFDKIRWKVAGAAGEKQAQGGYYVEYEEGVWMESRGWNQKNVIDASTMPHILKSYRYSSTDTYYVKDDAGEDLDVTSNITALALSEGDAFFIYERATWEDRLVGDDETIPLPSFVDSSINDIFFYKNRLGFLSGENIILSRSDGYFNFFPTSATTILDDDPIDLSTGIDKVSKLYHATPFSDELIIFSDFTQFRLTSAGALTPITVDLDVTSEYETTDKAKPIGIGSFVYFTVPQGDFTGIREYYVDTTNNKKEANDITAHVPRYLPKNIIKMIGSSNEDILLCLPKTNSNGFYVYRYFLGSEKKLMSSWSYWELEEGVEILDFSISDAVVDLTVRRYDATASSDYNGIYLEQIDLKSGNNDDGLDFQLYLDRKTSNVLSTYDVNTNKTTFTVPYHSKDDKTILVISGVNYPNKADKLKTTKLTDNTYEAVGDLTGGTIYAGRNFEFSYTFSEFFYKEQTLTTEKSNYKSRSLATNLTLQMIYIDYIDSGRFAIEVQAQGSSTNVYESFGQLSTNNLIIGRPVLTSGVFQVPLLAQPKDLTISIKNTSYLPSNFQSAEWLGNMFTLGRRI